MSITWETLKQNFEANSTNVTEVRMNEQKDENYKPLGIDSGLIK